MAASFKVPCFLGMLPLLLWRVLGHRRNKAHQCIIALAVIFILLSTQGIGTDSTHASLHIASIPLLFLNTSSIVHVPSLMLCTTVGPEVVSATDTHKAARQKPALWKAARDPAAWAPFDRALEPCSLAESAVTIAQCLFIQPPNRQTS
jgi:hypothetical protein